MNTPLTALPSYFGSITIDPCQWMKLYMETQLNTLAVKRVGWTVNQFGQDLANRITHGRISFPIIAIGEAHNDAELYALVRERARLTGGQVAVIGHGLFATPSECFVWIGTPDAFCEYWQGD